MAPGIDGLPAAERDVDVSGPVAEFLGSVSPRVLIRLKLGLRAFEWLPFPWRFSRLDPAAAGGLPAPPGGLAASRLHHDLLLMAKLFSTLGYAVTPEVQERIGFEIRCAARRRDAAGAGRARSATPSRAATARNATSSSSARAPAAPSRRRSWPRPGST